jgi:hypothetical protein
MAETVDEAKQQVIRKFRVITRAFYEDAYLAFFIKWYLDLGFQEILILKTDGRELPECVRAEIEPFIDSGQVIIRMVANSGNSTLNEHYAEFRDLAWDWVLNVDCDEFLVIDRVKYPGGVNDLVTGIDGWISENKLLSSPDLLQQIGFRWLCINKLDDRPWDGSLTGLLRNGADYPLHMYKYHKCMGKPKYMLVAGDKINCHFYYMNPLVVDNGAGGTKYARYDLFDDKIVNIRDNYVPYVSNAGNAFKWGCILHLNSRSMTNTLTKCLVTELRDNKKISNIDAFRSWINCRGAGTVKGINLGVKDKLKEFLNRKGTFPDDIKKWHDQYSNRVAGPIITGLLDTIPGKMRDSIIVDRRLEREILRELCVARGLNFDKCVAILDAC